MNRDWKTLPYWGTTVAVESTIGDIYKLLARAGTQAYRVTQQPEPWRLLVEWEQTVGETVVVVAFDITVEKQELLRYTDRQRQGIRAQAARLIWHTIKNLLAAHEAGLLSMDEVFLARMQTFEHGAPVMVGTKVLEQIRTAGTLGPTIIPRLLTAGKP